MFQDTAELGAGGGRTVVSRPTSVFEYAVITTQSCDVAARDGTKPWIQVAPVRHGSSFDDRALQQAQSGERLYLYPLDPVGMEPGPWIADLRIEVPVEKSWLVDAERVEGFPDEQGRRRFSTHLGKLKARAALGDHVSEHIAGTLRKAIRRKGNSKKRNEFFNPVVDLRLALSGTWEKATAAALWVISREALADDVKGFFDAWREKSWRTAMEHRCPLQSNEYLVLAKSPALRYYELLQQTVELDFDYMSPDSS